MLGGKTDQDQGIENLGIHTRGQREFPSGPEVKEKPDEELGKEHHWQKCSQRLSRELRKVMPIKYANKIKTKVPHPSLHREVGPAQLARGCLTNESPPLSYFIRIIRIFLTKVDFDGKGAVLSWWLLQFSTLSHMWIQSLLLWTLLETYLLFAESTHNRWLILKMPLRASLDFRLKLVEMFGDAWGSRPIGWGWGWEKKSWSHNIPTIMEACIYQMMSSFCFA